MESKKYLKKIIDWHEKAKIEKDYFIKFILQYISFIAFLNINNTTNKKDRRLIQEFKRNYVIKNKYFHKIDKHIIQDLMVKLRKNPINNVGISEDYRWDCIKYKKRKVMSSNDGELRSIYDFTNIIEYIYRARNNLFHGQKGPNFKRDLFIVKYGFKLLNPLMEILISSMKS